MTARLKALVRDAIPAAMQVPIKFYLNRWSGGHEVEMALLPYLVKQGDRAIDIGANRGAYTYRLNQLGVVVEAFEPNPACFGVLRSWARRHPSVAVHPVGLSDRGGAIDLHIPVDSNGVEHDASASMEPHVFANTHVRKVELRRLDDYAFDAVGFIKIDVEGHESKVLAGAVDTLARNKPVLLVEIEQRHLQCPIQDVFKQVQSLGYEGYFLDGGALKSISGFMTERDQSAASFAKAGARYINNFLFLGAEQHAHTTAQLFGRA